MDTSSCTDFGVDVENEDVRSFAAKLGLKITRNSEKIVLREEQLLYLNKGIGCKNDTLLMRYAELGKREMVELLLRCDGLDLNARNKDDKTAAGIAWDKKHYACLLKLLENDSLFPSYVDPSHVDDNKIGSEELKDFLEQRLELHEDVESGDLESVIEATKRQRSSLYLNLKNKSALYRAAKKEQLEVFAYLLSIGAKFKDEKEESKYEFDGFQKEELEALMEEYFIKYDRSHVYKLMASSKIAGKPSNQRKAVLEDLFNHLNKFKIVSSLMKVLEYEEIDIIFDFESECIERIYHWTKDEIYGLTDPGARRIYIGAKKCESENPLDKDVAGTLAHELCHLAMGILYENKAKPYGKDDVAKETEFERIVRDVKGSSDATDEIIRLVFLYPEKQWHSELIVRVPHLLVFYGERDGRKLLRKQVPELLKYYSSYVADVCEKYSKEDFFKKPLCLIQSLQRYHGCIEEMETESRPCQKSFKKFEPFLIPLEEISILVTSNTKLCCMHVYHDLKDIYQFHVDKHCLFFKLETFRKNSQKILDAFRCKVCHYVVLVSKDEKPDFGYISACFGRAEYGDEKKVIVIVNAKFEGLKSEWNKKVLKYQWSDLSSYFKDVLSAKNVTFKRKTRILKDVIPEGELAKMVQPEDLFRLTDGDGFHFDNGINLLSQGYNKHYFIERTFVKVAIKKSIFDNPPDSSVLFVTGLSKKDIDKFGIDERKVQRIQSSREEMIMGKSIFLLLIDGGGRKMFDEFFSKNKSIEIDVHWLHFSKDEFYWRRSRGSDIKLQEHRKSEEFTELQLIEMSHKRADRIVLIADDPGTGKSTVMSDVINKIKDSWPDWWIGRIDLNAYADDEQNPMGLANIKEETDSDEVIAFFIRMLGMKTSLEVHLFKHFIKSPIKKIIFFDGFDEISPLYKTSTLKLLRVLKKETDMQIWISTRKHEKVDLELEMDTFSYCMKHFSVEDQAKFLDGLWKDYLKSTDCGTSELGCEEAVQKIRTKMTEIEHSLEPKTFESIKEFDHMKDIKESGVNFNQELVVLRSGIDRLDFIPCALRLLDNARDSIKDDENLFTGLPLHLFMLGEVAYNGNLRTDVCSNIHRLYSDYVEGKIMIYIREKCRITQQTQGCKNLYDEKKEELIKCHLMISLHVMKPQNFQWDSIKNMKSMEYIHDIGIVTKIEDRLQFIHRTFSEYFFSKWILEIIKTGELAKELLEELLVEPRYGVVRMFVDGGFQNDKSHFYFNEQLINEFDVKRIFVIFIERTDQKELRNCMYIWYKIVQQFENVSNDDMINDFLSAVSKTSLHNDNAMNVIQILKSCFSYELLTKLADSHFKFMSRLLNTAICSSSAEDISDVLTLLKSVIFFNVYRASSNHTTYSRMLRNSEEMDMLLDSLRDPYGIEQTSKLLEKMHHPNYTLFYSACRNSDPNVFLMVMAFMKRIVGEDALRDHLIKRTDDGRSIIHASAYMGVGNIGTVLKETKSILGESSCMEVLKWLDDKGENFFNAAISWCSSDAVKQILEHLRSLGGCEFVRDALTVRNIDGDNILHHAVTNGDIAVLSELIKAMCHYLGEEEFRTFATSGGQWGQTVFHKRSLSRNRLRDLKILERFIGEGRFRELLTGQNNYGQTCLHNSVSHYLFDSPERMVDDLRFFSEVLDCGSLEEFLLRTEEEGYTFLLMATYESVDFHAAMLREVKAILSEAAYYKLINTRNKEGEMVRIVDIDGVIQVQLFKDTEYDSVSSDH